MTVGPGQDGEGEDHPGRSQQAALDQQGAMELVAPRVGGWGEGCIIGNRWKWDLENSVPFPAVSYYI